MKSFVTLFREVSDRFAWHVCHALVFFLLLSLIFERLVPGAVLGHISLFLAIPAFAICLVFHPLAKRRTAWWTLVDLWCVCVLCIGRIWMQLMESGPLAWLVAASASGLVVAFLWIFTSQEV